MINSLLKSLVFIVGLIGLVLPLRADNLGTLFTSGKERQGLEKLRHKKAEQVDFANTEKKVTPTGSKKNISRDAITLKGIVSRHVGENTVWINEDKPFSDNVKTTFFTIPNDEISTDRLTITIPDDKTKITLKVGETYTPLPIEDKVK